MYHGGRILVAPLEAEDDPNMERIIQKGQLMNLPVVMKAGPLDQRVRRPDGMCHYNSSLMWLAQREGIRAIGTGYALSDDGLWRQHSWAICADHILETTECSRGKYFGLRLEAGAAEDFAKLVLAPYGDFFFSISQRAIGTTDDTSSRGQSKDMAQQLLESRMLTRRSEPIGCLHVVIIWRQRSAQPKIATLSNSAASYVGRPFHRLKDREPSARITGPVHETILCRQKQAPASLVRG
jgi:hypothetical protein